MMLAHDSGIVASTVSATVVTTTLVMATVALVLLIAVPVGVLSVTRPESRLWRVARQSLESLSSLPVLLWCTAIVLVVARVFQQDPTGVMAPAYVIIALVMGDRLLAELTQRVAIATSEILAQPYMRLVRAGGFGLQRHLLQSLAGPVAATVLGRAMFLISGAIVAERIFGMPRIGREHRGVTHTRSTRYQSRPGRFHRTHCAWIGVSCRSPHDTPAR